MRRAIACGIWLAALVLAAQPVVANDGRIGVYADLTATQTEAVFSIGVPRTLYIVATLEGQSADGMTAAEFRVTGMPDDWLVFTTPNPAANVVLGDPFRRQGDIHRAILAFPGCQAQDGRVLLYTAVVIATSKVTPQMLLVTAADPPTNPAFAVPLLTRCDPPEFTKVPVDGGGFQISVRAPQDLDYSQVDGFDGERGVRPQHGLPGDRFRFRVAYTNAASALPAAGWPRLELDADGDGDAGDPGDAVFTMSPADLDSTTENGKAYQFDVALAAPPGGRYRYRFTAEDALGVPAVGRATAWNDSLFVDAGFSNLRVRAEDIRLHPTAPRLTDDAAVLVAVENTAERSVENVVVRIENVFGAVLAERTLTAIGPRATTEIALRTRFADFGFQPVIVRVDPGDQVVESDETDNVASHGVFAGGGGVAGLFVVTGLPPLVTVPPVAPFGVNGNAHYFAGANSFAARPVSQARVRVLPSWEAGHEVRTDAAGDFRVEVTPPAVPGGYSLTIEIDDGAHAQSTVISVQVSPAGSGTEGPHGPNLVMHVAAALDGGCPASEAVLSGTIENHGDADADSTTARVVAGNGALVAEITVGPIPAGASVPWGPIQAPLTGHGLHAFTAHADANSVLGELREDDNVDIAAVLVPRQCLDLALARVAFALDGFCADTTLALGVRVENRGCVASQSARVAARDPGGELASVALAALAPGESVALPFTLELGVGCNDLEFALDPDGTAGSDCDPTSGRLAAAACTNACQQPPPPPVPNFTVAACDILVSNASPVAGEPVQFSAWIGNNGPGAATAPASVEFWLDGQVLGGTAVLVGPIASGQRALAVAPVPWTVDFAVHELRVVVGANGQSELDPNDNQAARPLPFDLAMQPISRCLPASIRVFSNCAPCVGDSIDVRAQVINHGLFTPPPVRVEFRDQGGPVLGHVDLPAVPPGSACSIPPVPAVVRTALFGTGTHWIDIAVDPGNLITESNDGNNLQSHQLVVSECAAAPDLVATFAFPPGPTPQPGDSVTAVEVRVTNHGNGPSGPSVARLTLDGSVLCDLTFGPVPPQGSLDQVCTAPWVLDEACAQRLEVCADVFDAVGETNEDNNCTASGASASTTDLAVEPFSIEIVPSNPAAGQPMQVRIGVFNLQGVESTCQISMDWAPIGVESWVQLASAPVHLPPGVFFIPNALTLVIPAPAAVAQLRFTISDVCPFDTDLGNNVAFGSLPWFDPPQTPVAISDLTIASRDDGVHIAWRAEPGAASFAMDRRRRGDALWQRLPQIIAAQSGAGAREYEFVDRDAESGAQLEYRLVIRTADGDEEVSAVIAIEHTAARTQSRLHAVAPQPYRAGGRIEFSLRDPGGVELTIYDSAGRRVTVLHRGSYAAGRHAVSWDGRDATGRRVPAGVYFCRLSAGTFAAAQRVVLMH